MKGRCWVYVTANTTRQIVDHVYIASPLNKSVRYVRADETSGARNENLPTCE